VAAVLLIGTWLTLAVQTFLILNDWSTLEFGALKQDNIFSNNGYLQCWEKAFGTSACKWLIPTSADMHELAGLDFHAAIKPGGIVAYADGLKNDEESEMKDTDHSRLE